jgi:hypothetical protein
MRHVGCVISGASMSSGPKRRFTLAEPCDRRVRVRTCTRTVALSLALSLVSIACGSEGAPSGGRSAFEGNGGEPTPYAASAPSTSCTPSVALGEPVAAPLPSFTCPSGWETRAKSNALLVSGRFSNAREMVDALCTQSTDQNAGSTASADGEPAGIGIEIDFDANDVIAIAHDGKVGLHRRGGELWIRHTETCERSYDTALFVVPKNVEPLEQTCSMLCQ